MNPLVFDLGRSAPLTVEPAALVIAGWTGRNAGAIEHHIEELAALGVPRPSCVPLYYRASHTLLTQAAAIEVVGEASSGEVEPVLLRAGGKWWLSIGSDHTDRKVETYSVAVSKQICPKPIARQAWAWDEVAGHADSLLLRSEVFESGRWAVYQQGTLAHIRPLPELLEGLPGTVEARDGLLMFCGTLGAIPDAAGKGVRPAAQMRLNLDDPRTGRTLWHEYRVVTLPLVA